MPTNGLVSDTNLYDSQCSILVCENGQKWYAIEGTQGIYNFTEPDNIIDFAEENGKLVRFHSGIWPSHPPDWLSDAVTNETTANSVLDSFVENVLLRYKDKISSWDVVNEPIVYSPTIGNEINDTVFKTYLGSPYSSGEYVSDNYIGKFLDKCEEAELGGDLCINETYLHTGTDASILKRNVLLDIVEGLKNEGKKLDAIGLQCHLKPSITPHVNIEEYQNFLLSLKNAGVKILVTELGVYNTGNMSDDAIWAKEFLTMFIESVKPENILCWKLKTVTEQLPYLSNGDKSPLWYALQELFNRYKIGV